MLGGDDLLCVVGVLAAGAGSLAAETLDPGDGLGGDDDAAPAAAGEFEHGPDQRQGRGLAGEAADHLGAAADLDEGALERVGDRYERR
jgi:hypothetical protein